MTLRTKYTTFIGPIMQYALPIWAHASENSALNKSESVQARVAKIITDAVSSTNNFKAIKECGLEIITKEGNWMLLGSQIRQEVANLVLIE